MLRAVALALRARLRLFRLLREISLMTQPPLLAVVQGGELPRFKSVDISQNSPYQTLLGQARLM
jgi:hypothetical protein